MSKVTFGRHVAWTATHCGQHLNTVAEAVCNGQEAYEYQAGQNMKQTISPIASRRCYTITLLLAAGAALETFRSSGTFSRSHAFARQGRVRTVFAMCTLGSTDGCPKLPTPVHTTPKETSPPANTVARNRWHRNTKHIRAVTLRHVRRTQANKRSRMPGFRAIHQSRPVTLAAIKQEPHFRSEPCRSHQAYWCNDQDASTSTNFLDRASRRFVQNT